jgi:hypothetical protein
MSTVISNLYSVSVSVTHIHCPLFLLHSKIELCELQRFLWAQSSSRLSDELFDDLTFHRSLCDPADGTLEPPGFLEFSSRLLARSREVHLRPVAGRQNLLVEGLASGKEWASSVIRKGRHAADGAEDIGESVEVQVM